jgi:hypothetical protein
MIYKKDYYGYVYKWINHKTGMGYIGSHYGAVEDRYVGSGKDFSIAYKADPAAFTMVVLEYIILDDKKLVLTTEEKWLSSVPNIKDDSRYYNLNNDAVGGFGYITPAHIEKRAETLKIKHSKYGLSLAESSSYKQKIKTRLSRVSSDGFTEKEQEQHAKYGVEIMVTMPNGDQKRFSSFSKASKELGIDAKYGWAVCAKKSDFRGYKIVKLRDPTTVCYKRKE